MTRRLIVCTSCSAHVKTVDAACPHCGAAIRDASGRVGATACALLLGLSVAGCADDGPMNETAAMSASEGTGSGSTSGTVSGSASGSQSSSQSEGSSEGSETIDPTFFTTGQAYGVPTSGWTDTGTSGGETETDTDTDTDTGTESGTGTGTGTATADPGESKG
jgi:hypothetical protein